MRYLLRSSIIVVASLITALAYSADIASTVREGGKHNFDNGGYVEVGLVAGYIHNPFITNTSKDEDDFIADLDIGGEYRFNNFFLEASQGSQDGLNLGYTVWHNQNWVIDALAASISGRLSEHGNSEVSVGDSEQTRNNILEDRETVYVGAGVRVTHNLDDYVLQYRLVSDIFDDNGVMSTLRIGRGWQIQNWNVHSILSAQYTSEKTNQYLFGVSELEATGAYPVFTADESLSYSLLLGITRPLSENWVLRGYAGYIYLPASVTNSPLVNEHGLSLFVATLNYVF